MIGQTYYHTRLHHLGDRVLGGFTCFFIHYIKDLFKRFSIGLLPLPSSETFCHLIHEFDLSLSICSDNSIANTSKCYRKAFLFIF